MKISEVMIAIILVFFLITAVIQTIKIAIEDSQNIRKKLFNKILVIKKSIEGKISLLSFKEKIFIIFFLLIILILIFQTFILIKIL